MGLNSSKKNILLPVLHWLENYALNNKAKKIVMPINSTHHNAVKLLLENGYKVRSCSVRMVKKGSYGRFCSVDMSRWAM
jgi:hypothetical protein